MSYAVDITIFCSSQGGLLPILGCLSLVLQVPDLISDDTSTLPFSKGHLLGPEASLKTVS